MENQIVWEKRFNIGVEAIDKEHQKLFKIINKLFAFSDQEDKIFWVCQEGIKYFKAHTLKHFAEEEAYMESISYKELNTHRRLHEDFRLRTLPALEKELEQTEYSADAINHFLGVCTGWLIAHTLTEDHAIVGKEISKWGTLAPEEEQLAVGDLIIQLIKDMFQLEAQLVSQTYGGERFGNGVYYRLLYTTQKGDKQEIILVFEERLLIETVGKLIGDSTNKLNPTLLNAVRYTARQFVESIKEHFLSSDSYQLKSENLLTYEQFQKAFEKQKSQYSLLFHTESGYFAYCAAVPNLIRKDESSIQAENAISEIQKYLAKTELDNHNTKKKLLIVDDSNTILQAMGMLFQEDYHVATANSGVAAIRCISLEKPDLVLLDYNMPVCDGAQVLEMIRADPEFADLPVIFLTGTVDKASISKVLPLKPAGYLIKNQPPAEIKKNIDDYFSKKLGKNRKAK